VVPGEQEQSYDTAGHSNLIPTTSGDALEDLSIACDVTPISCARRRSPLQWKWPPRAGRGRGQDGDEGGQAGEKTPPSTTLAGGVPAGPMPLFGVAVSNLRSNKGAEGLAGQPGHRAPARWLDVAAELVISLP
jgi:hypothetical protein